MRSKDIKISPIFLYQTAHRIPRKSMGPFSPLFLFLLCYLFMGLLLACFSAPGSWLFQEEASEIL
jgi:hypothetical protein